MPVELPDYQPAVRWDSKKIHKSSESPENPEISVHGGHWPAWHGDALRETERRYEAGEEQPADWTIAKQELREHRE